MRELMRRAKPLHAFFEKFRDFLTQRISPNVTQCEWEIQLRSYTAIELQMLYSLGSGPTVY